MIDVARFDSARLERHVVHLGKARFLAHWAVERPSCFAGFIEFDHDIEELCPIPHDEVQVVLSGRAEYTFTSHPNHDVRQSVEVGPGDLLHIGYASMVSWRIVEPPFRVAFAVMPAPPGLVNG